MSGLWAKMARQDVPVCGSRWLGQGVQCVGQDGSDKVSSLWVKMTLARKSLLWCQESTRLGRPQLGGELPVSSLEGSMPRGHMFGESPTRCPCGVKGQGLGSPLPRRSGSHGKGMLVRLVGESPTFLHADLTLRADPAVSAQSEKKKKTKRPSTVARVRTTHTTRSMRAFEQTPDMTCLGVQNERSDKLVQRLAKGHGPYLHPVTCQN